MNQINVLKLKVGMRVHGDSDNVTYTVSVAPRRIKKRSRLVCVKFTELDHTSVFCSDTYFNLKEG